MAYFWNLILVGVTVCFVIETNTHSGKNDTDCLLNYAFQCADGNGCTYLGYRCDGNKDCADGSDDSVELCKDNCLGLEDRFQCADGTCIRSIYVCSGFPQCPDGSDEAEKLCSDCNGDTTLFRCARTTRCISRNFVCDSDPDCGENDPSDEDPNICDDNCSGSDDKFQCANKRCISVNKVCSGVDDCEDGSDESDVTCSNCNGEPRKIKCKKSGKCVSETYLCDGLKDCVIIGAVASDFTDEENCPISNVDTSSNYASANEDRPDADDD